MKKDAVFAVGKIIRKKMRARMTVEAACVLPIILFSIFYMIQAGITLHEKVELESALKWDNKYVLKIVRTLGE